MWKPHDTSAHVAASDRQAAKEAVLAFRRRANKVEGGGAEASGLLGLRWRRVGRLRPGGVELRHAELRAALLLKSAFTPAEWEAFSVGHTLRTDHFVCAGGTYFQPETETGGSSGSGGGGSDGGGGDGGRGGGGGGGGGSGGCVRRGCGRVVGR